MCWLRRCRPGHLLPGGRAGLSSVAFLLKQATAAAAPSLARRPVARGYLPLRRKLCRRPADGGAGDIPDGCCDAAGLGGGLWIVVDAPTGASGAGHGTTGFPPGCSLGLARSSARKHRSCSRPWLLVLAVRWRRRADWGKLLRAGAFTAVGLLLPCCRGPREIGCDSTRCSFWRRATPLRPTSTHRAASTPGRHTWLVRFRDVYLVPWNIDSDACASRRHSALGL